MLRPDGVGDIARNVLAPSQCYAPHLIDAELGSIMRRLVLRAELGPEVGVQRLEQALYVPLAIGLGRPLLTSDAKLDARARHRCKVLPLTQDGLTS